MMVSDPLHCYLLPSDKFWLIRKDAVARKDAVYFYISFGPFYLESGLIDALTRAFASMLTMERNIC